MYFFLSYDSSLSCRFKIWMPLWNFNVNYSFDFMIFFKTCMKRLEFLIISEHFRSWTRVGSQNCFEYHHEFVFLTLELKFHLFCCNKEMFVAFSNSDWKIFYFFFNITLHSWNTDSPRQTAAATPISIGWAAVIIYRWHRRRWWWIAASGDAAWEMSMAAKMK